MRLAQKTIPVELFEPKAAAASSEIDGPQKLGDTKLTLKELRKLQTKSKHELNEWFVASLSILTVIVGIAGPIAAAVFVESLVGHAWRIPLLLASIAGSMLIIFPIFTYSEKILGRIERLFSSDKKKFLGRFFRSQLQEKAEALAQTTGSRLDASDLESLLESYRVTVGERHFEVSMVGDGELIEVTRTRVA